MNTRELEKIAKAARVLLMTQCEARLNFVLSHEKDPIFAADGAAIRQLKSQKHDALIEKAAYTWFNRFMAFRFMDVHGFNRPLVVSPANKGDTRPQLLSDALDGIVPPDLPADQKKRVMDLLLGRIPSPNAQAEVYRLLFLNACKTLRRTLPFLFEEVDEPNELLLPDDLLSEHSVPAMLRGVMDQETCNDVEIIGWLFQFYISDKKDAVMKKAGAVSAEDLPARTQLFTPEWIVRYLVENSLGRMWLEHHPDSHLADHMRYYCTSSATDTDNTSPKPLAPSPLEIEDIKLLDPACGSGHILVYAFELLIHIYEEEGYAKSQIPELILRKNLYGLEIDPRAGQLAAFALVMKACLYDRSFLQRLRSSQWNIGGEKLPVTSHQPPATDDEIVHIGILRNIQFTTQEQQDYQKRLGKNLITQDLWLLMKQFENAETLGSLIIPRTAALRDIEEAINTSGVWDDLLMHETNKKLREVLNLARMLSPRYHVLVTNPPYLGNAYLSAEQKQYGADHFPNGKSDLFAMFFERGYDLTLPGGYMGYMSPYVWMFIQSYEGLRRKMIEQKHISSLIQMEYSAFAEATVPLCTFVLQNCHSDQPGDYFRLTEFKGGMEVQNKKYLEAIENPDCGWFYRTKAENFSKIPGSPIAYWINSRLLKCFEYPQLNTIAQPRQGLATADNNRFLRLWFECEQNKINYQADTIQDSIISGKKWFPHNKGGEFRKWYGNNEYLINWANDGYEVRHFCDEYGKIKSVVRNPNYYFHENGTWSAISSGNISVRYSPKGFIFSNAGMAIFSKDLLKYIIAFMNTKLVNDLLLKTINQTLNFNAGDISRIPLNINRDLQPKVEKITDYCIAISKLDWDSFETSWDFSEHPLVKSDIRNQRSEIKLEDCWGEWQKECEERFQTLKANEEELNRIFTDIYGLQDELTPDVDEKDVTVRRADLGRECRSLVSYAIGCIFGRYSLDRPGLQYAGEGTVTPQAELSSSLRSTNADSLIVNSLAGADPSTAGGQFPLAEASGNRSRPIPAALPLSDEQYSKDDAAELVQQFLKDAYGEKYYAENLRFLEAGLGKDLRSYLCNDFYADHLKIYQKRPIYWLFQSPKGSFKALIYLHRYVPGRAADVLALCRELEARLELSSQQPAVSGQLSKAEQRKAEKEAEKARAAFTEIKTWEKEVLAPLAEQRLPLDLDDGVKVNYAKFGAALAKIK